MTPDYMAKRYPGKDWGPHVIDESKAREILGNAIVPDGLQSLGWYLAWSHDDAEAVLDGRFTAEDLEAIAFWMRRT